MHIRRSIFAIAALSFLLTACFPAGDAGVPIPKVLVPAKTAATRLVVVLPGRGDDLAAMQKTGMAEAIQTAWPDADVILTGLSYSYYMQGRAPQRLHDEVIAPARQRGYRETWLIGASMGGMGTLMYDRAYPGEMDGLVLLAPYLGEKKLLREIDEAGGVSRWQPGPVPAADSFDNFQRELWRHIQSWTRKPAQADKVWLAYGDKDRLRKAVPVIAPALTPERILERAGGHDWTVWSSATREILAMAGAQAGRAAKPDPQASP
jgi:pimeloyl-ACP methyl ester carboxylesterase